MRKQIKAPYISKHKYNFDREYRIIASKVLGKPLPEGAVVHHIDGNIANNNNNNLVICENLSYHHLIHYREKALLNCGNASFRICRYCKNWDNPTNMIYVSSARTHYHRSCRNLWRRLNRKPPKPVARIISNHFCRCGCGEYTLLSDRTSNKRNINKGEPLLFVHGHNKGNLRKENQNELRLLPMP